MMYFRLVVAELWFRRWSAVLTIVITACATVAVFFFMGLSELLAARTRIIQRDLGLNLRFVPEDTDLNRYWMKGYAEGSIDEALVDTLEQQDVANRLIPMLQRTIPWGSGEAILTGVGQERFARNQKMKPAFGGKVDAPETVVLGSLAANMASVDEGDQVKILGHDFAVKRVLATEGSEEDIRIHADLAVVQELLGMQGRINEIRALECNCEEGVTDPEEHLRSILEPLLPGTMMIRQDRMADARRKQRQLIDRMMSVGLPVLVVVVVLIVTGLIMLNTYQRRRELGLYAVLGRGSMYVGGLIWSRSAILGCTGGLLGAAFAWIGLNNYSEMLVAASSTTSLTLIDFARSGFLGGAITSIASIFPVMLMMNAEPASVLRNE